MPEFGDAMLVCCFPMYLLRVQVSLLRVLQRSSCHLLSRLMILFAVLLRGSAMSVGRHVVQFGGSLMIFVM